MLHDVFTVTMSNMNPDDAVPLKTFLVNGIYACLNFRPRLDTLEDLPLGILIAAPHQASVTHYCVRFDIVFGLKELAQLVALLENLLIWAVKAVDRWPIPPLREEWTREGKVVDPVVANSRYASDVIDRLEENRKGVCEGLVEIAGPAPVDG